MSNLKAQESAVTAPLRLSTPAGPRAPPHAIKQQSTPREKPPMTIRIVAPDMRPNRAISDDSPKLPSIPLTSLGGESIEQFFTRIVDTSNAPSKLASQRPETVPLKGPHVVPTVVDDDDGRFADAEDDNSISERSSLSSSLMTRKSSAATSATSTNSGRTSPVAVGLGISTQVRRQIVTGPRAHVSNSSRERHQPSPIRVPPQSSTPRKSVDQNGTALALQALGYSSEKENASSVRSKVRPRAGTTSTTVRPSPGGASLERRRTLGDRHVQIVLPGEEFTIRKNETHPGMDPDCF